MSVFLRISRLAVASILMIGFLSASLASTATAQAPKKDAKASSSQAEPSSAKPKTRKKSRGRLPAYYAKVVNQKQREDIYEVQARYATMIADLQKQIDELASKRDQEVQAVLSDSQLAEIQKLKDEAKARRTARRTKTKSNSSNK